MMKREEKREVDEKGPRQERLFYGWVIVGVAFTANFISVGSGFYIFNVFLKPVCVAHQWSRTDLNLALILATVAGLIAQIFYGTIVMQRDPRFLMVPGALLAGGAFMLLGQAKELWFFYLLYILLYLGNGAYGGIVANTAVNNWFIAQRGRALGLATVGTSFSGVITPFLALRLLEFSGLAAAFLWIGALIMLMAPLSLLFIRRRPEDYGLLPDGSRSGGEESESFSLRPAALHGPIMAGIIAAPVEKTNFWTAARLVRNRTFWQIGLAYGLAMMGVVGVMSQLAAHFTDLGFSGERAVLLTGAAAFFGSVGKFFWAALCDYYDSKKVSIVLFLICALGLALILLPHFRPAVAGFVLLFGFGMGGVMSTFPVLLAEFYGRESFAAVARFAGLFLTIQIGGYYLAARSADLTASYETAYVIFILLTLVSVLFLLPLKPPSSAPK